MIAYKKQPGAPGLTLRLVGEREGPTSIWHEIKTDEEMVLFFFFFLRDGALNNNYRGILYHKKKKRGKKKKSCQKNMEKETKGSKVRIPTHTYVSFSRFVIVNVFFFTP